jgi:hypothetical protein
MIGSVNGTRGRLPYDAHCFASFNFFFSPPLETQSVLGDPATHCPTTQSPASHSGGVRSISRLPMWDLWWTVSFLDMGSVVDSVVLGYDSIKSGCYSFIHNRRCIIVANKCFYVALRKKHCAKYMAYKVYSLNSAELF